MYLAVYIQPKQQARIISCWLPSNLPSANLLCPSTDEPIFLAASFYPETVCSGFRPANPRLPVFLHSGKHCGQQKLHRCVSLAGAVGNPAKSPDFCNLPKPLLTSFFLLVLILLIFNIKKKRRKVSEPLTHFSEDFSLKQTRSLCTNRHGCKKRFPSAMAPEGPSPL